MFLQGNSLECEEDFVVAQEAGREEAVEETAQAQVTETIRALVATQAEEDFVAAWWWMQVVQWDSEVEEDQWEAGR